MNTKLAIELFGYLGSALVVVSMLMTSVVRLRVINLTGSIIFAVYALIIRSYPTAFMNFFLVGINVYHLFRLRNTKRSYKAVQLPADDGFVKWFVEEYQEDILQFFPELMKEMDSCTTAFAVFCDASAAGIEIGRLDRDGRFYLAADYTTPVYRDCSIGAYLFDALPAWGVKELIYQGNVDAHVAYVQKTGFQKAADGSYRKKLG